MNWNRKKILGAGSCCSFVILLFIWLFSGKLPVVALPTSQLNIVLSAHYDDAVLSLGGFLANQKNTALVATFFTENASTTSETQWDKISGFGSSAESFVKRSAENSNALHLLGTQKVDYSYVDFQYRTVDQSTKIVKELTESIKSLIEKNKTFDLKVYGPAFFGDVITHPDHKLLHQAFIAVAKSYVNNPQVSFFMYEDFPYIQTFNKNNNFDLKLFIEKNEKVSLTSTPLNLLSADVLLKEKAIAQYKSQMQAFSYLHENILSENKSFTSTRCGKVACEMTYKIDFVVVEKKGSTID